MNMWWLVSLGGAVAIAIFMDSLKRASDTSRPLVSRRTDSRRLVTASLVSCIVSALAAIRTHPSFWILMAEFLVFLGISLHRSRRLGGGMGVIMGSSPARRYPGRTGR